MKSDLKNDQKQILSSVESADGDDISVKDIILSVTAAIYYLKRKWMTLALALLIGGGLGFIYSHLKRPEYTAELTFVVQSGSEKSAISSYAGLAAQFGINLGGGSVGDIFQEENIVPLLLSRYIIKTTLQESFHSINTDSLLVTKYIDVYELKKKIEKAANVSNIEYQKKPIGLTIGQQLGLEIIFNQIIEKNLTIEKDKKSGIFTLRVKSSSEEFSLLFSKFLLKNISEFYISTKTEKISRNLEILQNKTDSVYHLLRASITSQASFLDQNPNMIKQIGLVSNKSKAINLSIEEAEYSELKKNLETMKFNLLNETPLFQIIDRPVLPLEKTTTSALKSIILGGIILVFLTTVFILVSHSWSSMRNTYKKTT